MSNKKIIFYVVTIILLLVLLTTVFNKNNLTSLITLQPACNSNADCDDSILCTKDICKNPGDKNNSFCAYIVITDCIDNDGCCPQNCQEKDNDCL